MTFAFDRVFEIDRGVDDDGRVDVDGVVKDDGGTRDNDGSSETPSLDTVDPDPELNLDDENDPVYLVGGDGDELDFNDGVVVVADGEDTMFEFKTFPRVPLLVLLVAEAMEAEVPAGTPSSPSAFPLLTPTLALPFPKSVLPSPFAAAAARANDHACARRAKAALLGALASVVCIEGIPCEVVDVGEAGEDNVDVLLYPRDDPFEGFREVDADVEAVAVDAVDKRDLIAPNSSTFTDGGGETIARPALVTSLATNANASRSEIVLGVRGSGGRGSVGARVGGGLGDMWWRDDVDACWDDDEALDGGR